LTQRRKSWSRQQEREESGKEGRKRTAGKKRKESSDASDDDEGESIERESLAGTTTVSLVLSDSPMHLLLFFTGFYT